jgi:hypothetical protein
LPRVADRISCRVRAPYFGNQVVQRSLSRPADKQYDPPRWPIVSIAREGHRRKVLNS